MMAITRIFSFSRPKLTQDWIYNAVIMTNQENGKVAIISADTPFGTAWAKIYSSAFDQGRDRVSHIREFPSYSQAATWSNRMLDFMQTTSEMDEWLTEYGSRGPYTRHSVDDLHNTIGKYNKLKWQGARARLQERRSAARLRKAIGFDMDSLPTSITFELKTEPNLLDGMPDWLGKTSNERSPGAINHQKRGGRAVMHRYMPNKYYIPATSKADHRKWLQAAGYSRGVAEYLADSYVWQDYKRFCTFGEKWHFENYHLSMYIDGEFVCDDWLCCIESDCDESHKQDIADNMKHEMLLMLRELLEGMEKATEQRIGVISDLRQLADGKSHPEGGK